MHRKNHYSWRFSFRNGYATHRINKWRSKGYSYVSHFFPVKPENDCFPYIHMRIISWPRGITIIVIFFTFIYKSFYKSKTHCAPVLKMIIFHPDRKPVSVWVICRLNKILVGNRWDLDWAGKLLANICKKMSLVKMKFWA